MMSRTIVSGMGALLVSCSLTGCTTGSNASFLRPTTQAPAKVSPPPRAAVNASAAPAKSSAWANTPASASARTTPDPAPIAAPMGNSPTFTNQPNTSITPAGGIALPVPAAPVGPGLSANPAATNSASLLPSGRSLDSLNATAPRGGQAVAANTARGNEPTVRSSVAISDKSIEESFPPPPPMPAAPVTAELMPTAPDVPTALTPAPVVLPALPPTKVRSQQES